MLVIPTLEENVPFILAGHYWTRTSRAVCVNTSSAPPHGQTESTGFGIGPFTASASKSNTHTCIRDRATPSLRE